MRSSGLANKTVRWLKKIKTYCYGHARKIGAGIPDLQLKLRQRNVERPVAVPSHGTCRDYGKDKDACGSPLKQLEAHVSSSTRRELQILYYGPRASWTENGQIAEHYNVG